MIMSKSSESASKEADKIEENDQKDCWNTMGLYIFLPLAGLTLIFGRRDLLTKLLMQVDRNCVSVLCPSLSKREKLLNWARGRLPLNWSSHSRTLSGGIFDLWSDGSLLCTLLNTAIPGACPNPHRHWKKPPSHAQAMAYKYLGVVPIFTDNDLTGDFTSNLERNFINYLNELQQAITKFQSNKYKQMKYSSLYIARGMGLATGEQYKESIFYIYPNKKSNDASSSLLIQIRGPYGTYGQACVPAFFNNKPIPLINIPEFAESKSAKDLPTINLKNAESTTDIEVNVEMEKDRAKVTYIARNFGMYEINLISNGELTQGCPYNVNIIPSILRENDKNIQNLVGKKRIVSKFIQKISKKVKTNTDNKGRDKNAGKIAVSPINEEDEEINNNNSGESCMYANQTDGINLDLVQLKESESSVVARNDNKLSNNTENVNMDVDKIKENERKIQENDDKKSESIEDEIDGFVNVKVKENDVKVKDNENLKSVNKTKGNFNVNGDHIDGLTRTSREIKSESNPKTNNFENSMNKNNILNIPIETKNSNSDKQAPNSHYNKYFETSRNEITKKINEQSQTDTIKHKNKIQIPDKFNDKQTSTISALEINNKYFYGSKNDKTTPPKNSKLTPKPQITSSICSDHIETEVKKSNGFNQLPAEEKRKIFSNNKFPTEIESKNSSFSECENVAGSNSYLPINELSVLNVLGSLKQMENHKNLSGTKSLPDIKQLENCDVHLINLVREKKDFWEQLSSVSSSTTSISHSETSSCKSGGLKHCNRQKSLITNDEHSKSANDLLSLDLVIPCAKIQKFKSFDNALDNCTRLTIEERKKLLLKQKYEDEKMAKQQFRKKFLKNVNLFRQNEKTINDTCKKEELNVFTPIEEKIRIYDKSYGTLKNKIGKKNSIQLNNTNQSKNINKPSTNFIHNDLKDLPNDTKNSIKLHIKKAMRFFKNLEENSRKLDRRHSFDVRSKKTQVPFKRSGSLNLQKISERFNINNLYSDVFGNGKGSFRGTPNRKALSKTLSNFDRIENIKNNLTEDEVDNIKYTLFKKGSKTKSRKSIQSLFEY